MTEQDGSPGGGSVTVPPVESPAQGAAQPPAAMTTDDIRMSSAECSRSPHGVFADLRKAGALKQEKPAAPAVAAPAPGTPPAAEHAPDVRRIVQTENAIGRAEAQYAMSAKQVEYMRSALTARIPTTFESGSTPTQ